MKKYLRMLVVIFFCMLLEITPLALTSPDIKESDDSSLTPPPPPVASIDPRVKFQSVETFPHYSPEHEVGRTLLPPESIDYAFLINVHFHYYEDLFPINDSFIADIFSVMKPGGKLYIQDGTDIRTMTSETVAKNIISHYLRHGFRLLKGPEHIHSINEAMMVFQKPEDE